MSDLRALYQETIFDHYRRPRNCHPVPGATHRAEGYNPLCGDRVTLYLRIEDGVIKDAGFEGAGCAIATASASLMTEALKGRTQAEVEALFERFHTMATAPSDRPASTEGLGKLAVLAGVREFPARIKCATLAWHTLHAALGDERGTVSTE
ncbi:Fe-S cluster assembly sulfur transfer protein SufU [Paraburkholderia acidiphila]|uniref:SUF system NifU family Fe-S cluster assembly protein n=1 Tax=Paraburkholderia acidiphila TaxID=2571747 RepID=A0A7Z2JDG9_9BURK|nr:SUF system NifU family Fe-S cluster assembly protein [Paraburkholderia acidiphila]QGZ59075.1 SUF system NifU family Fe-S cluster assembly protein [Paraburkholderia acidiphila]